MSGCGGVRVVVLEERETEGVEVEKVVCWCLFVVCVADPFLFTKPWLSHPAVSKPGLWCFIAFTNTLVRQPTLLSRCIYHV